MRVSSLALIAVATFTILLSDRSIAFAQTEKPKPITPADVAKGVSTWQLDNEHTSLVCAVSHYGLSFIYGRFNTCSGSVEMNFEAPNNSTFRFQIDPDSVDTNDMARDMGIRGQNCLESGTYSSITFQSLSVESKDREEAGKTKRTFLVTGNLTIHGITKQLTIPVELLAMGNGPDGELRCGFMSRFAIRRSEFGLDALSDSVGDNVAVTFCFQAKHTQEATIDEAKPFRFGDVDKKENLDLQTKQKRLEKLFSPKSSEEKKPADDKSADDNSEQLTDEID